MNDLLLDINEKLEDVPLPAKIAISILLVAGIGYYSWKTYVPPEQNQLEEAKSTSKKLDGEIADLRRQIQGLDALQAKLREAESSLRGLLRFLPADLQIAQLLSSFSDKAKQTGIEIKEFVPGTPSIIVQGKGQDKDQTVRKRIQQQNSKKNENSLASSPLSEVPIQVTISGTYHEITQFLDKMMELPRIIQINNLELQLLDSNVDDENGHNDGTSPKLLVKTDFLTFFQGTKGLDFEAYVPDLMPPNAVGGKKPRVASQPSRPSRPPATANKNQPPSQTPQPEEQETEPEESVPINPNASLELDEIFDGSDGLTNEQIQALSQPHGN